MNSSHSTPVSSVIARICGVLVCGLSTALLTTGCGVAVQDASLPDPGHTVASLGGRIYGGANPVVGATVNFYVTGTAYGTYSTVTEANTTAGESAGWNTDSNGDFSFPTLTCPTGTQSYAYVVATAGQPSGDSNINTAITLVAALGRCEDLPSTGTIYMNEATTVAAAYALRGFASVTGSGASLSLGIGAPATNNSAYSLSGYSAGCVSNTYYTTAACPTTSAAGLLHAFQNAANLINVWSNDGAHTTVPGNSAAIVPQALINTIADIYENCVDSIGATSPACTIVFGATAIGGTKPTNTFSSLINLASNPTLYGNGNSQSIYTFYNVVSTSTTGNFFTPIIPAGTGGNPPTNLVDFSIAINYPKGMGASTGVQGLTYVQSGALDINDTFYIGNQTANTSTQSNMLSISSNGTFLGGTTNSTTYIDAYGISTDALGSVYASTVLANPAVLRYTATKAGVLSSTFATIAGTAGASNYTAVDRANNMWFTTSNSSTPTSNLFETSSSGTTATAEALTSPRGYGIGIDPDQNIWVSASSSTTTTANYVTVLQNMGSPSAPAYSSSSTVSGSVGLGEDPQGIVFSNYTTPFTAYALLYNQGAAGTSTQGGIIPLVPTLSTTTASPSVATEVTAVTPGTEILGSPTVYIGPEYGAVDGAGTVFAADNVGARVVVTVPSTGVSTGLRPCIPATAGATACTAAFSVVRSDSVDSTGSVWVTGSAGGNVAQIIGAAVPAWPLLSLGVLGKP